MVQSPTLTNWFHLIILGIVWGGTFMVISIALEGYGPVTVACARTTLGAVSLLIWMKLRKAPLPRREALPFILGSGVFSTAVPFILLSWGLQYVPSSFAGVAMAFVPLFVLPIAHFFSDEALTKRRTIGVAVGFLGAFILVGPGALGVGDWLTTLGQIASLGAALCYAVSSVQTRNCPPIDPITMSAFVLVVGSVALVPAMLILEGVPSWQGVRPSIAIIALGLFPTAFATALRVLIIRSAGSVFMTLVNYQVPVWALVFGSVFLGESLPYSMLFALPLVLAGLFISQFGALQRLFFNQ
ncbi:MAG: DMT family transporter [Paracoccaceae bacterium]|jgi:drug/metabolite transporter (DMT)-like permease|nr:DMT family transporter [Paracoccaceae bacterium]MDP7184100.1 DMT family transporter [Paracoccaceae bacterium]